MKLRSITHNRYNEVRMVWYIMTICAAIIIPSAGIIYGVESLNRTGCREQAGLMDREYNYGFHSGCMVRGDDGKMYPIDNVHVTVVK